MFLGACQKQEALSSMQHLPYDSSNSRLTRQEQHVRLWVLWLTLPLGSKHWCGKIISRKENPPQSMFLFKWYSWSDREVLTDIVPVQRHSADTDLTTLIKQRQVCSISNGFILAEWHSEKHNPMCVVYTRPDKTQEKHISLQNFCYLRS